ncbi:SRPBCC family protein [Bradyrhizobium cajani]|uniref:Polyketide cyclase/dehydrase n=1 Tax=Bradyrhizobium cajani TaxID=1928661 RepID=A0A844TDZ5_9BRAD|nr:SRPBCC family protein [Bradyrhizobium cajani]MCP3372374.1 SRPBCC family protein [Bradyrhizobium cajani]MVT77327.1 polyketide cyclase/dehydrase [Bradyrhizobium cajani]
MNREESWQGQYAIETSATVDAIWRIFRDVAGWKAWNAGIEQIDIEGPFSAGTWFTMKPPGEETLRSQLVEVRENECFVDETRLGSLVITVAHQIERLGPTRTRIIYAVDARGPQASEIGPAVASDFPDVLASLANLAEAHDK